MLYTRLTPQPRAVTPLSGHCRLPEKALCGIDLPPRDAAPILHWIEPALPPRWDRHAGNAPAFIALSLAESTQPPEAYTLRISPKGIAATANAPSGLFRAATTLRQILRLAGGKPIPCAAIEDSPDLPVRGVMLDVSRDRTPTLATLFGLVDRLAELKINHLELYMENTFAYPAHPRAWENASPYTPDDIRSLDAYCAQRFISLTPNQNSLGHFERWLRLKDYLPLAELPQGGAPLPWGGTQKEPAGLAPADPGVDTFIEGLYDALLPCFRSRLVNIGCDETFDLGLGKSKPQAAATGKGRVYLDYLLRRHAALKARGHTMSFWGDIILHHPQLIPLLPRDCIAIDWGYEADHPFAATIPQFAAAKIPFWVAPGTSSWNALAGRTSNMRANIQNALTHALAHGAAGLLICDWGDAGHWQTYPVRLPGLLYGAACGWAFAQNRGIDIARALDAHIFHTPEATLGRLTTELGDLYLTAQAAAGNAAEFFRTLNQPLATPIRQGFLSLPALDAAEAHCLQAQKDLKKIRSTAPDAPLLLAETAQTLRFLLLALRHARAKQTGFTPALIRSLRRQRAEAARHHAACWLNRDRLGGLPSSLARIEAIDIGAPFSAR